MSTLFDPRVRYVLARYCYGRDKIKEKINTLKDNRRKNEKRKNNNMV